MNQDKRPFGFYRPNFKLKCILHLVKLGLGSGNLKRKISNFCKNFLNSTPVDIIYQGLKFRLFPYGNTIENKMLFSRKVREKGELKALSRFLTPQSIFLDIGANIGYYSLNVAKFGVKKIIAVEPNPIVLQRLKDNIAFNNYADVISVAKTCLGDKRQELIFTIPDYDMGGGSAVEGKVTGKKIKLNCITLEDLLKKESIVRIDAIKIDVEGLEDKILLPYFASIQPKNYPSIIVIEDNSDNWEKNVISWLLDHNYDVYSKTHGNLILRYVL